MVRKNNLKGHFWKILDKLLKKYSEQRFFFFFFSTGWGEKFMKRGDARGGKANNYW